MKEVPSSNLEVIVHEVNIAIKHGLMPSVSFSSQSEKADMLYYLNKLKDAGYVAEFGIDVESKAFEHSNTKIGITALEQAHNAREGTLYINATKAIPRDAIVAIEDKFQVEYSPEQAILLLGGYKIFVKGKNQKLLCEELFNDDNEYPDLQLADIAYKLSEDEGRDFNSLDKKERTRQIKRVRYAIRDINSLVAKNTNIVLKGFLKVKDKKIVIQPH